jgi:hypothetical protein
LELSPEPERPSSVLAELAALYAMHGWMRMKPASLRAEEGAMASEPIVQAPAIHTHKLYNLIGIEGDTIPQSFDTNQIVLD